MSHQISVLIVLDHFAQNLRYLTVLFPVLDLIKRDDVHEIETSGEGHIVDDPVGGNGAELEQFGEGLIDLLFKIREVIEEPTYLSAGAVKGIVSHIVLRAASTPNLELVRFLNVFGSWKNLQ